MAPRTRTLIPSVARAAFASLLALLFSACSSAPQAPPGGEAASKAAYGAAEAYAKGLRRGIERGKRDRAVSDLQSMQRALEQYAADQSAYPEADSCAALHAALFAGGGTAPPDRDPWGAPYECRARGDGYFIRSAGEDGVAGSEDDVVVRGGAAIGP